VIVDGDVSAFGGGAGAAMIDPLIENNAGANASAEGSVKNRFVAFAGAPDGFGEAGRRRGTFNSLVRWKLRQQGIFGVLMITPRWGSRGPGLLMPIAATASAYRGLELSAAAMASWTEARPSASVPRLDMGTRVLERMFPRASTNPAATFVPPISTPR
jgi:hypothetical protein